MATAPPRVRQIHHTGFTVSDLDRSIAFYVDNFGCEVLMRHERRGGYMADLLGLEHAHVRLAQLCLPDAAHVLELMEFVAPQPIRTELEPRLIGAGHLCFDVEDLDTLHERLLAAGARPHGAVVRMDSGPNAGGASAYVLDPDGIVVQLREPRPVA